MKLFTKLCVALTLFAAAVLPTSAEAKAKSNYKNFKVAIYTRAYEVEKMTDPEWLKSTWDVISNQVKVDKIYLFIYLIKVDRYRFAGRGADARKILSAENSIYKRTLAHV